MQEPFPRLGEPQPDGPPARWGLKEMVLCVVVVLVALFVLSSLIVLPVQEVYGEDAPETLTASAIMNVAWNASMIGAVFWFVRRAGGDRRDLGLGLPADKPSWSRIIGFVIVTFLAMEFIVYVYSIIVEVFGFDFLEPDEQVPDEFYDSDVALAVLGVAIVLSAPITEEIFFRGFLFGGTRAMTGALPAALITGFIFSLAHYNPGLILPFTLIGAVLAMSYHRSGSLFVPIGAHFLFNLISFSVLVFFPEARPSADDTARVIGMLLPF